MKTEKIMVEIDGQEQPVIIRRFSGTAALKMQEHIAEGTTVTKDGNITGFSGSKGIDVIRMRLQYGIAEYPPGINTLQEFLDKIDGVYLDIVYNAIVKLNTLQEGTKKKSTI